MAHIGTASLALPCGSEFYIGWKIHSEVVYVRTPMLFPV